MCPGPCLKLMPRPSLRWTAAALPLAAVLACAPPSALGADGDGRAWPWGRWNVVERGWDLDSPLQRLEIRRAERTGDAVVIAYEANDPLRRTDRVWGSARLDMPTAVASSARWMTAEWNAGLAAVVLQIRPERDGRLCALIRLRDRNASSPTVERIRQAVLERDPTEVVGGLRETVDLRSRFTTGGSETLRADLAGVFAVHPDGSGLRVIALPDGFSRAAHPAWSPDGRWLAFTAFDSTGRDPMVRIVSAEGGRTVAVAAGIAPSWSHDGRRIAYVASGRAEYATDWNNPGRNDERIEAVRLTGPSAGEIELLAARGLWPRWAPDDDRLAFVARRDANWDVYLRSADGLHLTRLTDDPALDTHPVWTSNGRAVVLLSDRGNRWDLYRVEASGRSEVTRLTNHRRREEAADLSPKGDRIVFVDGSNRADSRVLILDLASGLVRPLVEPANGDRDPVWSPAGQEIAFASRRPSPASPERQP